ncbi:translationally-controlled tumor protein-like [Cynocephalus volans]|uniref:translationally-controlled tumor protein-like n=1 Tax=Cynocephalus volans TaxID=110931 RepID=UPI002FCBC4DE
MIIYRDLISHDEMMFSYICRIQEIADELCLEVEGKMVSRTEGNIDDSLTGGNASAEGPEGEGTECTAITGVDIVMNHHLQEISFTKEAYKKYVKDYMKSIKDKLEEQRPERVKPFMTRAAEYIKMLTNLAITLDLSSTAIITGCCLSSTTPGHTTIQMGLMNSSFILSMIYLEWRHCF